MNLSLEYNDVCQWIKNKLFNFKENFSKKLDQILKTTVTYLNEKVLKFLKIKQQITALKQLTYCEKCNKWVFCRLDALVVGLITEVVSETVDRPSGMEH